MLSPVTVQPDIPYKVSQIRHDLDDLHELVSRVEKSQTRIEGVLEQHDNRFEELQQTLNLHGGRLDGMDGRLDSIEDSQRQQLEHLSAQMAEILGVLRGPRPPTQRRNPSGSFGKFNGLCRPDQAPIGGSMRLRRSSAVSFRETRR